MKRFVVVTTLLCTLGCPAFVGDVRLVVWQPEAIESDQLSNANEFVLEVETEAATQTRSFTDADRISLSGLVAPVDGGDARISLNLVGGAAAGALGRSGVSLAPDAETLNAAMVLAPPDTLCSSRVFRPMNVHKLASASTRSAAR